MSSEREASTRSDDELAMVRMLAERGEHDEARALCQRLLEDRPQSAAVRAAMGDVAGAEGNWNEAVQWYERALELDFDALVMEKLAGARSRAIHSGQGPTAGPTIAMSESRPAPAARTTENTWRKNAPLLIVAAVLLVVLILVIGRAVTGAREARQVAATAPAVRQRGGPTAATEPATPPADIPPPAAAGARAQLTGKAVQTPARYTGQVPPRSTGGEGYELRPATPTISTQDLRIMMHMQMEKWRDGSPLTRRASMAFDSYSGVGILTLHAPSGVDIKGIQEDIIIASYRAALRSMKADADMRTLVVRCVATVPGPQGEDMDAVVFRATATRDRIARWLRPDATTMPPPERIAREILADVWWDTETLSKSLASNRTPAAPTSP